MTSDERAGAKQFLDFLGSDESVADGVREHFRPTQESASLTLAPQIKAELLIAGADNDASYPPEMAERLVAALTAAGVRFHAEIYTVAAHGWMKPDFPVYDEAAAERGWAEMLALFARCLH